VRSCGVRATTLAAFAHQDLPFEELVATLERERALEPAALAQVMILLQNAALRPIANAGRKLAFEEANPSMLLPLVTVTTFDVILMLRESAHGLVSTNCTYSAPRRSIACLEISAGARTYADSSRSD